MLNKIMLIGNLGKDPELQLTAEGTPFTRFSLAVNRSHTSSSGEKVEETEWFNIVVWRQLAEICERYLHKGSKVYIKGRLSQRKYTDREGVGAQGRGDRQRHGDALSQAYLHWCAGG